MVGTQGTKSHRSKLNRAKPFDYILTVIMLLIIFITLYPVVLVVSLSISDPTYVMSREVYLWPRGFSLESYSYLIGVKDLWTAYGNTIFITVVGTALNVLLTTMLAYSVSRPTFCLRNVIMVGITITMFFSGGLVPSFINVSKLGLYNSRWALTLPVAVGAYYVIIARTFISSIPESLHESALLDGASEWQILVRIYIPLSMPILAVLTLYYAVDHWNAYFGALLYLPDKAKQPVQLYLRRIVNDSRNMMDLSSAEDVKKEMMALQLKYSVIVIVMAPIMCVYPFLQKYFVKGVMIGAIKS